MEIAEKRWKVTDRILKNFQSEYKGLTRDLRLPHRVEYNLTRA